MWSVLLSLSILTLSPTPTLWHFDGPLAYQAQEWVLRQYSDTLTDHLLDEEALQTHVEGVKTLPSTKVEAALQACIKARLQQIKKNTCSLEKVLLDLGQLNGHVYMHTSLKGQHYHVKLLVEKKGASAKIYEANSIDLKEAGHQVIQQAFGIARYEVSGLPSDAQIYIDGQEIGQGNGSYVLTSGVHQLKIVAKNYQVYENSFSVSSGQKLVEKIKMLSSLATLDLKILHEDELENIKVTIDGEELSSTQFHELIKLKPAKHLIKITATDRQAISKEFELNPGEDGKLVVNLQYDRAFWKILLKTPHLDTKQGAQQITFRLQSQTLRAGAWDASVSEYSGMPTLNKTRSQTQSANGFGFDLGFTSEVDPQFGLGPMRLDVIGYNFERFTDAELGAELKLDNSSTLSVQKRYDLEHLDRHKFRIMWLGYQLPMWRITPYFQTGLMWVYERGEIVKPSSQDTGIVSNHSLRIGWETGADIRLTPEWVIKVSMAGDVWPGERGAVQTLIGGAYAFDAFSSSLLK